MAIMSSPKRTLRPPRSFAGGNPALSARSKARSLRASLATIFTVMPSGCMRMRAQLLMTCSLVTISPASLTTTPLPYTPVRRPLLAPGLAEICAVITFARFAVTTLLDCFSASARSLADRVFANRSLPAAAFFTTRSKALAGIAAYHA